MLGRPCDFSRRTDAPPIGLVAVLMELGACLNGRGASWSAGVGRALGRGPTRFWASCNRGGLNRSTQQPRRMPLMVTDRRGFVEDDH